MRESFVVTDLSLQRNAAGCDESRPGQNRGKEPVVTVNAQALVKRVDVYKRQVYYTILYIGSIVWP